MLSYVWRHTAHTRPRKIPRILHGFHDPLKMRLYQNGNSCSSNFTRAHLLEMVLFDLEQRRPLRGILRLQTETPLMLCHSLENHLVRAYVYLRLKHAPEGRQRKNAVFMIKYRIPNHSIPCPTTSSDPRCKKMQNDKLVFLFFIFL